MCFAYGTKKKLRNVVIGLFFLFGGIEYGVIIPTLWLFLQHTFGANEGYYSIVLSAFSFSSLIASPFFGAWIDFTRKTKITLFVGLFFEIGGNFLYFSASSKYLLLAARVLCGVGDGVGSVLFAQVVRTSSVEERTSVLSMAMAARQIGLVLGPALNLITKSSDFYIGPFLVNNYRSPGILMCVIWSLMFILVSICYYDLPTDNIKEAKPRAINDSYTGSVENGDSVSRMKTINRRPSIVDKLVLWKELLNEEVIVILMTQFIVFFELCSFEALFAPLMERLLGWQETRISYIYTAIGIESIIVYAIVGRVSKRIADRWLMVFGVLLESAVLILYVAVLAPAQPYDPTIFPTICVGTFGIVLGLPFLAAGGVSLYSKLTHERTQGFLQGVRRSFLGIGTILGALWGGSLFRHLYILLGVLVGLFIIAEIMMVLSFRRLRDPGKTKEKQESTSEERQPLLT
ncbi:major facilitator superfamily domain-containing protein 8-like [Dendronephthya gigantea]|uniref:major facilitator superfamily domain-containing protein 8-like n=1 Tax=Dendronephthya gigantea TaxID=151771 RepID=UPI00106927D5|nr:major facilitator superfamily domain-containing protein 8-like [Dendronephthya gigantea]